MRGKESMYIDLHPGELLLAPPLMYKSLTRSTMEIYSISNQITHFYLLFRTCDNNHGPMKSVSNLFSRIPYRIKNVDNG
jgi:hypothetical protein